MLRILHGDTRDLEACPTEAKRADRHEQRLHTLDPGPEVVDPLQYQLVAGKGGQIHAVEYRAGMVSGGNARAVQEEILRNLSPKERLQMVRDLTIGVQELAFAAIRQAKPQRPAGWERTSFLESTVSDSSPRAIDR